VVISLSGIIGLSGDFHPWVGRLSHRITGRQSPHTSAAQITVEDRRGFVPASGLADPGEWIAAGFSGEGMTHAWMCGAAIAHMILKTSDPPLITASHLGTPPKVSLRTRLDSETSNLNKMRGNIPDWLPYSFLVTNERWKKTDIEDLLNMLD